MASETARQFLERLVEAIQVPRSKYEDAVTSFKSICAWFERDASTLRERHRESFLQGSFRLGTAIRPTTEEDDYDLDIVVLLIHAKAELSQSELKRRMGVEVKSYASAHGMTKPTDARRCWTQDYADERQFHVDTLPAIPDVQGLREKLEARNLAQDFVADAIAITDKTDANYDVIHEIWPNSNPRGYAQWFESRMAAALSARKAAIALAEQKSATDIPTYRAQTPLQRTVQLLKYHRDVMFAEDPDDRPISVIITTLAAHAYQGELQLDEALNRILRDMDAYIEQEHGIDWVRNPTNAMENFADKWIEYPKRRENFYKWLDTVRSDFAVLSTADDETRVQLLTENFGEDTAARVARRETGPRNWKKRFSLTASHREEPPWDLRTAGTVRIKRATRSLKGFRTVPFSSDSSAIAKGAKLKFFASTDVPRPFQVFWQITNTGDEARRANNLRGDFEVGAIYSGNMSWKDAAAYTGTHSIECFIVKDEYLVARSGQFLVNVA